MISSSEMDPDAVVQNGGNDVRGLGGYRVYLCHKIHIPQYYYKGPVQSAKQILHTLKRVIIVYTDEEKQHRARSGPGTFIIHIKFIHALINMCTYIFAHAHIHAYIISG